MGKVVDWGPATKLEITTSSKDNTKESNHPATNEGVMMGSVMAKKDFRGDAPRSMAASIS